jgi:serine/threonine-protein kinase
VPLASGSRLGSYEVIAAIGHGGMGEVYRARDTKLGREVALKILPNTFAYDPERLARFAREAQLLAALSHPHICAIYGLEDAGDSRALVLELVEGPTLADRIAEGPIPVDDALAIAKQIADALEAAHAAGIVHRDLKPANIKLRADGTVKVLDFGLAKAVNPASGHSSSVSLSPTITSPAMTQAGLILGTAAYMSPEQAKGKAVDRRADIWAFGAVLFEMLTGRRAFAGDETSEVLASVLAREPQMAAIPESVPGRIRQLLKACLPKDPKQRIHDMADVRLAMDGAFESPRETDTALTAAPVSSRWKVPAIAAAVLVAAALGGLAAWALTPVAATPKQHFAHRLGEEAFTRLGRPVLAISTDHGRLAYVADNQIYLRNLDDPIARPLNGTNDNPSSPFFSQDGEWIGFWANGELKKVQVAGGTAIPLTKAGNPLGASWTTDGTIVYAQGTGIWRVTETGGVPEQIVKAADGERMHAPQILPGGDGVLFAVTTEPGAAAWDTANVMVHSLATGERTLVHKGGAYPRYLTSGHLVYVNGTTLFALPFDLDALEARGGPKPVISGIRRSTGVPIGIAQYAVSESGALVYVSGTAESDVFDLVMIDRDGMPKVLPGSRGDFRYPRMSPDDTRIAVQAGESDEANIWIYDRNGSQLQQLTFEGGQRPLWTRDGKAITFRRGDEVWQIPADFRGVAERVPGTALAGTQGPHDWNRNGKVLLHGPLAGVHAFRAGKPLAADAGSADAVAIPPPEGTTALTRARFSPNGQWVAFMAGTPGTGAYVFVGPFPHRPGGQRRVTNRSAISPVWSRDGRELYVLGQGVLDVLEVLEASASTFRYTNPKTLFSTANFPFALGGWTNYDVTRDGQFVTTMLVGSAAGQTDSYQEIQIVLNWGEELKRLVPTD